MIHDLKDINFIFCSHPLYPNQVDEGYEEEFHAAEMEHACTLFSYEKMEAGKLSLRGAPISGLTVYRGWMMKPDMYAAFYNKLREKGIMLINTPEEYARYHMLPGWYEDFIEYTAASVWEDKGTLESALQLTQGLEGPYIVKDYVKSRKHEWYDACFIRDIADKDDAGMIIGNFIERQGSDLVGGVVLRKFEKLRAIGLHEKSGMPVSEEYRVFICSGKVLTIGGYWQDGQEECFTAEERQWIEKMARKVKSRFVTMDLARREDGSLVIIELGDGQVSGLQQINAEEFYRAFGGI